MPSNGDVMIAFKDFKRGTRLGGLATAGFDTAVKAANEWLTTNAVQVINVETISDTGGVLGVSSTSQDGVRVWYTK